MFKSITVIGFILASATMLFACQTPQPMNSEAKPASPAVIANNSELTQCKEPRSRMCTKEYRPVCAIQDTGFRCVTTPCTSTRQVTKSNACTACADESVSAYTLGKCE